MPTTRTQDPILTVTRLMAALTSGRAVNVAYERKDGVVTLRTVTVHAVERCQNGRTIARVYCVQSDGPRSFDLTRIHLVSVGTLAITEA